MMCVLFLSVNTHQSSPFGTIKMLRYSKSGVISERIRVFNLVVTLDGQK